MTHPRRGRTCEVCGNSYDATYSEQRTCSRTCGVKINRSNPAERNRARRKHWPQCKVYFIPCAQCGGMFTSPSNRRRVCSSACLLDRKRDADRSYNKTRPKREYVGKRPKRPLMFIAGPCRRCGESFVSPNWGSTPDVYCSQLCQKRAERCRLSRVRRARKRNAEVVESFDLREIAERDRLQCGLCHRKVDMALRVTTSTGPNPGSRDTPRQRWRPQQSERATCSLHLQRNQGRQRRTSATRAHRIGGVHPRRNDAPT